MVAWTWRILAGVEAYHSVKSGDNSFKPPPIDIEGFVDSEFFTKPSAYVSASAGTSKTCV